MTASVIIPYNLDRGFLKQAIESIEHQTYPTELILSQSDKSVSYNINRGLEKATGDYIRFCSEDNLLTPNCIEDSLKAIDGYDFIHGKAIDFWANGTMRPYIPPIEKPTLQDIITLNVMHGGTVMYRRDCFDRFGGFDERLWCGEEYEFNMRLLSKGCKLNYCNSYLQRYRRHGEQKSLGNTAQAYQAKRQVEMTKIKNRFR